MMRSLLLCALLMSGCVSVRSERAAQADGDRLRVPAVAAATATRVIGHWRPADGQGDRLDRLELYADGTGLHRRGETPVDLDWSVTLIDGTEHLVVHRRGMRGDDATRSAAVRVAGPNVLVVEPGDAWLAGLPAVLERVTD